MPQTNQSYYLRSGLVLHPSQQRAIEKLLTNLSHQIAARFILLADVSGQVISTRGEQDKIDIVSLGSLVAGDLAASHEIARLTRQYQADQMVFREGKTINTFTCEAGYHFALLTQVPTATPLGWARMVIRKAAGELANIAATSPPDPKPQNLTSPELTLQKDNLPNLFDDALDDLWLE